MGLRRRVRGRGEPGEEAPVGRARLLLLVGHRRVELGPRLHPPRSAPSWRGIYLEDDRPGRRPRRRRLALLRRQIRRPPAVPVRPSPSYRQRCLVGDPAAAGRQATPPSRLHRLHGVPGERAAEPAARRRHQGRAREALPRQGNSNNHDLSHVDVHGRFVHKR